jgi:hypothetical protein
MNEPLQAIGTIVSLVGGTGAIIVAVITWLGKVSADRLHEQTIAQHKSELEALRKEYAKELEMLKANIAERQGAFDAIQEAFTMSHGASHDKVLLALETLWEVVLDIQEQADPFLFPYQILLPKEYESLDETDFIQVFREADEFEFSRTFGSKKRRAEGQRLFVGERLWQLFEIYSAFCGRAAFKAIKVARTDGKLPKWDENLSGRKDTGYLKMLRLAFTETELEALTDKIRVGVPNRIVSALQAKMLDEMNKAIFGKKLAEVSLEERQRLDETLRSLGASDQEAKENKDAGAS